MRVSVAPYPSQCLVFSIFSYLTILFFFIVISHGIYFFLLGLATFLLLSEGSLYIFWVQVLVNICATDIFSKFLSHHCTLLRLSFFFFLILFIYLFIWLCWVFVSVQGLSLVVASGGHSSSRCAGLSLSRPLPLRSTGSRRAGSVVVAHRLSCSVACGIFPDQGSNRCPLHWQADSQPLHHQGSP